MTLIYLVRHGNTDLVGKRLCGNTPGIPLNAEGRQQAQKAADYLSGFSFKALFTSPIERAVETAGLIGAKIGLSAQPCDFLKEIYFGDLQGMYEVELRNQPLWQQFLSLPGQVAFPNGESIAEAQMRVAAGLEELAGRYDPQDRILCVAHSEILRLAIAHILNLPLDSLHRLTLDTASISIVELTSQRKKVRLLNFTPA